jgi:RND family efflux transporter MFP subunit
MKEILPGDPQVGHLRDILQWASLSTEHVFFTQHDGHINTDREETRAKFERYFEDSGMRGFFATPLVDEQGRVGMLSFESADPDFLTSVHIEMIKVLSGQATVALRNAQMYKEVPFISLLEPVLHRKRKFMALEKSRRRLRIALAVAVLAFLVLVPFPFRVEGAATVAPSHSAEVQAEVDGVVASVNRREGDRVFKGDILGKLDDWKYRSELAAAEARYTTASSEMNRALAANNGAEAGVQRIQADFWSAEVARARERLEKTNLRSPIDGTVATPHIEDLVGHHLQPGNAFARVVDTRQAIMDVAVDDRDIGVVRAGEKVAVKLDSYPTRTLRGQVVVVSPMGQAEGDQRLFYARVRIPNEDGIVRAGMQGRGKVLAGWRPAGYVLFRGPVRWVWSKLWWWFGW